MTWTPTNKTVIAQTEFSEATTHQLSIPSVIPDTAREFLLYATVLCGYSHTNDLRADIIFYVEDGGTCYEKFLHMHTYRQSAYNTNSDNMWFPMPSNRLIHIEVPVVLPGNCSVGLKLLSLDIVSKRVQGWAVTTFIYYCNSITCV